MNPLARVGVVVRRGFGKVVPEPLVIAIMLTAAVMFAALLRGMSPADVLDGWDRAKGLWALLKFAMQMCLMLVLGSALAAAPAMGRGIAAVARVARSPRGLVAVTAGVSIGLAILNWSLSLIGGALLAREAGAVARSRGWRLHYPLLCAAGYSGLMVWHGGLSGSAPLKATNSKDMIEVLGPELAARIGTIPLTETLLSDLNLLCTGGLLVLGPILFFLLTPSADPDPRPAPPAAPADVEAGPDPEPPSWIDRIERSSVVNWLLAVPLAGALGLFVGKHGIGRLDFDHVNIALWCAALLLHKTPDRFLRACEQGVRSCTGVILQFPLYAGIMGIMAASGLSVALSELFASAGRDGFASVSFASAGVLNLLVPSGGGQWAVQGPILMRGSLELGVEPGAVVMAMAYGDQWTNMLQPFWALPLLAITGVRARDIVGYASLWMLAGGIWMLAVLLWRI